MPRKLSVDSAVMALRMFITTMNEMDEKKFGASAQWVDWVYRCLLYTSRCV